MFLRKREPGRVRLFTSKPTTKPKYLIAAAIPLIAIAGCNPLAVRRSQAKEMFHLFLTTVVFVILTLMSAPKSFAQGCPLDFSISNITGAPPFSVAVGDFNKDGNQDLATANFVSGNVSILLGNGMGGFPVPTTFTAGALPKSLAVGDFNKDGNQDLATANPNSNNVSILLGNGMGGFPMTTSFPAGSVPNSVAVGDFNKDGNQDLATTSDGGNVSILLGDGNGAFSAPTNFSVGANSYSIAVGDFNKDGNQDLAATNYDTQTYSGNVSILLGDGMGSFFAPTNFPAGGGPNSVAVGDFNKDGNQDLATANQISGNVSILLGVGNGTFSAPTNFTAGSGPRSVAVGDFNQDGNQDLATANGGGVSILLGVGNGTFSAPTNFSVGGGPISVAVGDFNKDGGQDLVTANSGNSNVSILLGIVCQSACPPAFSISNMNAGGNPFSVAVGDFNKDGNQDLATANRSSANVSILLGNSNGTFSPSTNFSAGAGPVSVAVGDFNKDGKQDMAVANSGSNDVSILLGNGNGTFSPSTNFAVGSIPQSVAVGDFNKDGKQDLAVANEESNNVSILLGNGDGTFSAPTNFLVGSGPKSVAVGDFNKDGKQDLAVANIGSTGGSNNVSILLGNGMGSFSAPTNFPAGGGPFSVAVGDFNQDGKQDLAVANAGIIDVSILLGNGDGTFSAPTNFSAGSSPFSVAVGDFNQDGKQDLAVANETSINVSILLGDGTGGFSAPTNFTVGLFPVSVAVGDFNQDGKQDLAVANQNSGTVSILLGIVCQAGCASITCPSNITVNAATGQCGAIVNYPQPTTSGNCSITSTPPSGSFFSVGTTTVMVTDAGGTASCSFTVTVVDNQPPQITAPQSLTVYTGPTATSCGVTISNSTLGNPTVTDNCGANVVRSGVPANNFFPVGSTTITYTATDDSNNTAMAFQTVTVIDNTPPTISAPSPITASVNGSCQASVPNVLANVTASDNCTSSGSISLVQNPAAGTLVGEGSHNIVVTATDASGNSSNTPVVFNVVNNSPTASAGGPYSVNEGGSVAVSATGSDPEGSSISFAWDLNNDGIFETTGQSVIFSAVGIDGPDSRIINVKVTDSCGAFAIAQTSVNVLNVSNVAPTTGAITAPVDPVPVNTTINTSASFTDSNSGDTHTAIWQWGDTTTSNGVVTESNGSGTVSGSHNYTTPGIYTVTLTVTDNTNSDEEIFQYVVVYDPNGGFVTGGGWINSPAGAYTPNPSLTGKANFGFNSKYQHGANVPTGNTEFQFKVANFNFKSTVYEWLVVAGARAQFKGSGTINGSGDYGFMLTAIDGQEPGGGGTDKFRIKIFDKTNGGIIYDNQFGVGDDQVPSTVIGGGSIVIHK